MSVCLSLSFGWSGHVLLLLGFSTWIVKPASVEQECGEGDEGGKTAEHRPVVFQVSFFLSKDRQKKSIRIRNGREGWITRQPARVQ